MDHSSKIHGSFKKKGPAPAACGTGTSAGAGSSMDPAPDPDPIVMEGSLIRIQKKSDP